MLATGRRSTVTQQSEDLRWMQAALALGRRSLGLAAPNPSVGALVVRDGIVLGRGVTAPGGRPHAEPVALAQAGDAARGATLYVTLEPCSHHGKSPPCVEAVLRSGVARVVVALRDADPRVAGRGLDQLRAAGLAVIEGVGAVEARRDHLGHLRRVERGRPMVTLKMAQTADGIAAASPGAPRLLVTGPAANRAVQMLRATHDAILVGGGTVRADDPLLTVRLPGVDRRPLRVVLDTTATLPPASRLVQTTGAAPVLVLAGPNVAAERESALADHGVSVSRIARGPDGLDLPAALRELGARGVTRLLCEGGPRLASALIRAGLADRVVTFTGSRRDEGPGLPAFGSDAAARLRDPDAFTVLDEWPLGPDLMRVYEAK